MADSIFLLRDDDELVSMTEKGYASEDHLQDLLARYPQLLSGEQVDPTSPRRWLLISREAGIPDGHDSGNRWAVDHLFLVQDGVPTLVEVKRGTNSHPTTPAALVLDTSARDRAALIRAGLFAFCRFLGRGLQQERRDLGTEGQLLLRTKGLPA